jgi:hypothetical protein
MIVIKRGGAVKAALDVTNGIIDSKIKIRYIFIAQWYKV